MISPFIFKLILSLFPYQDCEPMPLKGAIEATEIIVRGTTTETIEIEGVTYIDLQILEVYKSEIFIQYETIFIVYDCELQCNGCLEWGKEYLVYGINSPTRKNTISLDGSYRTKKVENALDEISDLSNLPCREVNEVRFACPRHLSPVCGCDGKTYGNACGASSAGITKWKEGKCEP